MILSDVSFCKYSVFLLLFSFIFLSLCMNVCVCVSCVGFISLFLRPLHSESYIDVRGSVYLSWYSAFRNVLENLCSFRMNA